MLFHSSSHLHFWDTFSALAMNILRLFDELTDCVDTFILFPDMVVGSQTTHSPWEATSVTPAPAGLHEPFGSLRFPSAT